MTQQLRSMTTITQREQRCMGKSTTPCVMMTQMMTGAGGMIKGVAGRKAPPVPSIFGYAHPLLDSQSTVSYMTTPLELNLDAGLMSTCACREFQKTPQRQTSTPFLQVTPAP